MLLVQGLKMMQGEARRKNNRKKVREKFAGSGKVPTFAIPLRNKGASPRPPAESEGEPERPGGSPQVRRRSLKRLERKYKEASTKHKRSRASISFF